MTKLLHICNLLLLHMTHLQCISLVVIYAVLTQNLFWRELRTFVWSQLLPKNLVCGSKQINIMYAGSLARWRE